MRQGRHKGITAAVLTGILMGGGLDAAQMPAQHRPLVDGFVFLFSGIEQTVLQTAEAVPESLFGYKPTPDVRSLGAILGHIADSQNALCAGAAGKGVSLADTIEKSVTTKTGLVAALRDSFARCKAVYGGMTDADVSKLVPFGKNPVAVATILSFAVSHSNEHYGNLVTYMRLNGIVPPSSRGGDRP